MPSATQIGSRAKRHSEWLTSTWQIPLITSSRRKKKVTQRSTAAYWAVLSVPRSRIAAQVMQPSAKAALTPSSRFLSRLSCTETARVRELSPYLYSSETSQHDVKGFLSELNAAAE